jgi:hypothetical protein
MNHIGEQWLSGAEFRHSGCNQLYSKEDRSIYILIFASVSAKAILPQSLLHRDEREDPAVCRIKSEALDVWISSPEI